MMMTVVMMSVTVVIVVSPVVTIIVVRAPGVRDSRVFTSIHDDLTGVLFRPCIDELGSSVNK